MPHHALGGSLSSRAYCGQEIGDLRARDVVRLLVRSLPEGQLIRALAMATQCGRDLGSLQLPSPPTCSPRSNASSTRTTPPSFRIVMCLARWPPTLISRFEPWRVRGRALELDSRRHSGSQRQVGQNARTKPTSIVAAAGTHHSENFFKAFDVLLLDEAKDLSAAQVSILLRAKKHCGILIVGDVFQKIYGFRAAQQRHSTSVSIHRRLTSSSPSVSALELPLPRLPQRCLDLRKPAPWERAAPKPVLTGALGVGGPRLC